MSIIEQIKAEIESRKKSLRAGICNEEVFTRKQRKEMLVASEELDRLNRFLSTLEEKSEKPIIPNDRDIAAKEYAKTTFKKPHSDNPDEEVTIVEPDKYAGFIAGAKWDKEQMMSNAVEGTVYGNGIYTWVAGDIPSQFKYGDKVRVIVLPKED